MMRQLESLVGEERLQAGLREYLDRYAFANASWPDLIDILDATTDDDLAPGARSGSTRPGGRCCSSAERTGVRRQCRPCAASERPRRQRAGLAATVRDRGHGGCGGAPNIRSFFVTLDPARRACGRRRRAPRFQCRRTRLRAVSGRRGQSPRLGRAWRGRTSRRTHQSLREHARRRP